jgi:hypothetical protein
MSNVRKRNIQPILRGVGVLKSLPLKEKMTQRRRVKQFNTAEVMALFLW